jgi:alpha-L-arabinofuranosidase
MAITLINRHYTNPAVVHFGAPGTSCSGQLLSAPQASAVNSIEQPDSVHLVDLPVSRESANNWRVELPSHSMATVVIA